MEGRRPKDGSLRIQEETTMSFDIGRLTGATVSHLKPRTGPSAPETGGFAQVYDLTKARRGAPEIPPAVWDEVEQAGAIAADLEAQGRTIRFSDPAEGGRVRAELVDASGNVLRPVSLGEIVTIGSTEPPSAA
jgi:hypothetical protein